MCHGVGNSFLRLEKADLAGQPAQKFSFVHSVFESLVSVDKDDRHFVIKLPAQFVVAIHIHFMPSKPAAARELHQALLHDLAKMTSFARINHDLAGFWHAAIVSLPPYPLAREKKRIARTNGPTSSETNYRFNCQE